MIEALRGVWLTNDLWAPPTTEIHSRIKGAQKILEVFYRQMITGT